MQCRNYRQELVSWLPMSDRSQPPPLAVRYPVEGTPDPDYQWTGALSISVPCPPGSVRPAGQMAGLYAHHVSRGQRRLTNSGIADIEHLGCPCKRHPSPAVAGSARPSPIEVPSRERGRRARAKKAVPQFQSRCFRREGRATGAEGLWMSQTEPANVSDRRIDETP